MNAPAVIVVVAIVLGSCGSPDVTPASTPSTTVPAATLARLDDIGTGLVVRRLASGGIAGAVMSDLSIFGDGRVELAGFDGVPFDGQIVVGRSVLVDTVAKLDALGAYDAVFDPITDAAGSVADGVGIMIELADGQTTRTIDAYALGEAPDAYPADLHEIDAVLTDLIASIESAEQPGSGSPPGATVAVVGNLHISDGVVRLCGGLAESFPPQCAADNVIIVGLEPSTIELSTEQGIRWTDGRVVVVGVWRDGVLDAGAS